MKKDILVVDTNVFINAIFDAKNYPNDVKIMELEQNEEVEFAFSEPTQNELFKILSREVNKSDKYECAGIFMGIFEIIQDSKYHKEPSKVERISKDRSDQKFVNLAVAIGADFVITNDKKNGLLKKKKFQNIQFVTPSEYIKIINLRKNQAN